MDDGTVLEQGTHSELLRHENGPYAAIFTTQNLHYQHEVKVRDSDSDTISVNGEETVKKAKDDVHIGRRNSAPSLVSDIIGQKRQASDAHKDDYSLTYLFMRMGKINSAAWKNYVTCSTYLNYMRCNLII